MNTTDNGRTEARSRANRRLRRMTIGTTMLGVVATGSIGWLAAATYHGTTAAGTETAIVSGANDPAATSTAAATATPTATTAPTVSTATGNGHASSGGS
jgi:hypothetical protein